RLRPSRPPVPSFRKSRRWKLSQSVRNVDGIWLVSPSCLLFRPRRPRRARNSKHGSVIHDKLARIEQRPDHVHKGFLAVPRVVHMVNSCTSLLFVREARKRGQEKFLNYGLIGFLFVQQCLQTSFLDLGEERRIAHQEQRLGHCRFLRAFAVAGKSTSGPAKDAEDRRQVSVLYAV